MRTVINLSTMAALLAWQVPNVTELIRQDRERLQGTWKVIAAESKGEKVPAKELADLFLIFDGDTIQVQENKKKQERYSYRLSPDRKPKEIDFVYTKGAKKGRTDRAIYQFQAERLTFCIQEDENEARPKEFATQAGTALFLVVLERAK